MEITKDKLMVVEMEGALVDHNDKDKSRSTQKTDLADCYLNNSKEATM